MSEDKKKSTKKIKEKKIEITESASAGSQKGTTGKPKRYEEIHFVDSTKPVWNYSLFSEEDIIRTKKIWDNGQKCVSYYFQIHSLVL